MNSFRTLSLLEKVILVFSIALLIFSLVIVTWVSIDYFFSPPTEVTGTLPAPGFAEWQVIKNRGRIIAGVSGDFPPFSSYPEHSLDGYDINLLQALAAELGLGIEFVEVAPEGMGSALKLGQIDLSVSGSSALPELLTFVEFSLPYFTGEDAFLVTIGGSSSQINSLVDLSQLRIAVVQNTLFQAILHRELVQTGIMPVEMITETPSLDVAIDLLLNRSVDGIYLDSGQAQSLSNSRGFVVAGTGLAPMRYAIAVRKGNQEFIQQLNEAYVRLVDRGIVAGLQMTYWVQEGTGTLFATPKANDLPTATPLSLPLPNCLDGMEVIDQVDQQGITASVIAPRQPFSRTWRIKNIGTCPWDTNYRLEYIYGSAPGARMGSQPVFLQFNVMPGVTYDIKLDFIAGNDPGVFQGFWQMVSNQNKAFGERIESLVQVVQSAVVPATSTPSGVSEGNGEEPSSGQSQVTVVDFEVVPVDQINLGECVSIRWTVEGDIQWVRLLRNQTVLFGDAGIIGNYFDCPAQPGTLTYSLEAFGQGGSDRREASVNVFVQATPTLPVIIATSSPPLETTTPTSNPVPSPTSPEHETLVESYIIFPVTVLRGGCVTIKWSVSHNATSVKLLRDGTVVIDPAPASGTAQDCLKIPGLVVYGLVVADAQGSTELVELSVSVEE